MLRPDTVYVSARLSDASFRNRTPSGRSLQTDRNVQADRQEDANPSASYPPLSRPSAFNRSCPCKNRHSRLSLASRLVPKVASVRMRTFLATQLRGGGHIRS